MGKRKPIKTTIERGCGILVSTDRECGLSVDWSEATTHCWRCGCEKNLERCHIVPDSKGGADTPSNIVLLCKRCHIDGPNVKDPEVMWDWIRAYGVACYETFWNIAGLKEYEFIYHHTFRQDIAAVFNSAGISPKEEEFELVNRFMHDAVKDTSFHFGHPYLNVSTLAGVYRIAVKNLAAHLGVSLLREDTDDTRSPSWWVKYI